MPNDSFSHYYSKRQSAESRPTYVEYALPRGGAAAPDASTAPASVSASADVTHTPYEAPITKAVSVSASPAVSAPMRLSFVTDSGVFAKSRVDAGSDLLIRSIPPLRGRALDFGCGYGVVGISLARMNPGADIWFSDVNERAVELCRENYKRLAPHANAEDIRTKIICSDSFAEFGSIIFDSIFLNPPVRAGKAVIYKMYRDAADHLNADGSLYVVIQKKQGMKSTFNELLAIFGNCVDIAAKSGYHVLKSTR